MTSPKTQRVDWLWGLQCLGRSLKSLKKIYISLMQVVEASFYICSEVGGSCLLVDSD